MARSFGVGDEVDRLREEIEAIDRSLVLLLGARRRAQHRLLAHKLHHRLPLTDPFQERLVSERARAWAEDQHSDSELAENVVRLAVAAGKRAFFHGSSADDAEPTTTVFVDLSTLPSPENAHSAPKVPPRAHATS